jgi:hypothetical protein
MSIEFSPYDYDNKIAQEYREIERKSRLDIDPEDQIHTVVDSFERWNKPRRCELMSRKETAYAELSTFSPMDREEQILMICVMKLFGMGYEPSVDETLYEFIERCDIENMPNGNHNIRS